MAEGTGSNSTIPASVPPVGDDERLYRRVPSEWYNPRKGTKPIPQRAFMPRPWVSEDKPGDMTGLSVSRADLTTVDHAATMPHNGKKAHLAEFGVSDVVELQLTVKTDPLADDLGHSLIPELNSLDRRDPDKEARMEEWAIALRDSATIVYEAETA
ncbi:MAG: hypothetical protein GC159_16340 [Phycisphaera sp.]|nr:hypothetical protein [Phycisphaera sp.]